MSNSSGSVISLHGIRVLIVEDVASISMLVSKFVTRFGAEDVDVVETVGAAWSRIQKNEYDIVLLDYMLGSEIGLPLIERIRQSKLSSHKRLAVIVLTATKAKELMDKSIEAGADGYLAKPVHPERLADRMLQAVEARRARAERWEAEQSQTDGEAAESPDSSDPA